jgi:hypothetical protein
MEQAFKFEHQRHPCRRTLKGLSDNSGAVSVAAPPDAKAIRLRKKAR